MILAQAEAGGLRPYNNMTDSSKINVPGRVPMSIAFPQCSSTFANASRPAMVDKSLGPGDSMMWIPGPPIKAIRGQAPLRFARNDVAEGPGFFPCH